MYNRNVSEKVRALSEKLAEAEDAEAFFFHVTGFYRDYGVGMFGLNKAFRIAGNEDGTVRFLPINNMDAVMLDDLIGYELQKKKLVDNTKAFVEGIWRFRYRKIHQHQGHREPVLPRRPQDDRDLQAPVQGSFRHHRSGEEPELPVHHLHG